MREIGRAGGRESEGVREIGRAGERERGSAGEREGGRGERGLGREGRGPALSPALPSEGREIGSA